MAEEAGDETSVDEKNVSQSAPQEARDETSVDEKQEAGGETSVDEKDVSQSVPQEDGDGDVSQSASQVEEEEEEECGFCLFMKAGPCGVQFKGWQECVEGAEKSEKDIVEQCAQMTTLLKVCMESNPQYYGPVLDAEKAMQADIDSAEVQDAEKAMRADVDSTEETRTEAREQLNSS